MTNILVKIDSQNLNQAILPLAAANALKNNGPRIMSGDAWPFEMTTGALMERETPFKPTYREDQNMRDCSIEQLVPEAIGLINAGYRTEPVKLPAYLGVSSHVRLPKEKYGTYAAGLREWRRS